LDAARDQRRLARRGSEKSENYFARVAIAEIESAMGERMQIKTFDTLPDAKAWLQSAPTDYVM
jgi:hypothetical protein